MQKPKVIAIVGPTASGKSSLGEYLAKKLGGEIVSADSRQVYRGMEVISRAEPGHMVGIADPRRRYSAGQYVKDAKDKIVMIYHNNRIPIVVGGTGFYAEALLGHAPLPEVPPNAKLRATLAKKSPAQLLAQLKRLDQQSAARVDPNNKVRLIRAIEIANALGKVPKPVEQKDFEVLWLGISPAPASHLRAIKKGVESRLKTGMAREAARLRKLLLRKRYGELGFEFSLLAEHLDKKISKEELSAALINGERKYAIRQMRWFRRNKNIRWIRNKSEAFALAKSFLSR